MTIRTTFHLKITPISSHKHMVATALLVRFGMEWLLQPLEGMPLATWQTIKSVHHAAPACFTRLHYATFGLLSLPHMEQRGHIFRDVKYCGHLEKCFPSHLLCSIPTGLDTVTCPVHVQQTFTAAQLHNLSHGITP